MANVYETLVTYNGNSTSSYLPALATCVPGTVQCSDDYGSSLVTYLGSEPTTWTFVIDPSARFYDPGTGDSWSVYPSDVMFSIARDLAWADRPYVAYTPGWILAQDLLPVTESSWDSGFHTPYNTTPSFILSSMAVNDSAYCPSSAMNGVQGNGCVTFLSTFVDNATLPFFLQLVADNFGTSIVPCGWFTSRSAGVPGFAGTDAPHGDGSCLLPGAARSTTAPGFQAYLSNVSTPIGAKSWDSFEALIDSSNESPQSNVRWSMAGSGPYYQAGVVVAWGGGYTLKANPAYAEPSGCSGAAGLAKYGGDCYPAPTAYVPQVDVTWEQSDQPGLNAAQNGTADVAEVQPADVSHFLDIAGANRPSIEEIPTLVTNQIDLNLNWSLAHFDDLNLSEPAPNIPSDFFASPALRNFVAEAYPYQTVESGVLTTEGVQFGFQSGGPIPKDMPPYSASLYAPSGNVTFPAGNPNTDPSDPGGAAWWWSQATDPSSPYYDPELASCGGDSPCTFPIVGVQGYPQGDEEIEDLITSIESLTNDSIQPYTFDLSFNEIFNIIATNSSGNDPFPVAAGLGWAPDYPDPTDYLFPYAQPGGTYAEADDLSETLGLSQYDEVDDCEHSSFAFANLTYWANVGHLTPGCQGVAYGEAEEWMASIAHFPLGATRTLDYNLISHILNELAPYVWLGQQNVVVAIAPWINGSSLNTNPIFGGSSEQLWFQVQNVVTAPSTSEISVGAAPSTPLYAGGRIYVPNNGSASITVISGSTDQVLANVSVGSNPETPAYDNATNEVFVANFGSDNVSVLNATSEAVVATIAVGSGPQTPVFDPADGDVFVANVGSNTTSVISGVSNTLVATVAVGYAPLAPAYDPVNDELYVPNAGSNNVSVISGSSLKVAATVSVGTLPLQPVCDPNNQDVYVPNFGSHNISVIYGVTNKVVATIDVGTLPFHPAGSASARPYLFSRTTLPRRGPPLYDPTNGNIYIVNAGSDNVSVIPGARNTVLTSIAVGTNPQAPVVDTATGNVYVANSGSNNLSVISGTNNSVVASIPTGPDPSPPVFDNSSGQLYVPDSGSDNVTVVVSDYYITFEASGLPSNAVWHVVVQAAGAATTGGLFSRTTAPFPVPGGVYVYTIEGPSGYRVVGGVGPSGTLTVTTSDLIVPVTFARGATYAVTFRESGLPKGVTWCATLGAQQCSTAGTIQVANLTPYRYPFGLPAIPGFKTSLVPGGKAYRGGPEPLVNVTTHGVTVKVKFVGVTYSLTFDESGLAAGKGWTVRLTFSYFGKREVKQLHSTKSTITFEVPNGTFTYTVTKVTGYTETPAGGTVSVTGAANSVAVVFTKLPPPAMPLAVPGPLNTALAKPRPST